MATEHDARTHQQPGHDATVKGGQHSPQNTQQGSNQSSGTQHDQGSGSQKSKQENNPGHNQPGHESQVKGGQHSGSQKK
jgi:hypothetical protein